MKKVEILRSLKLGGIIAEQDDLLSQCFISHPVLGEIIEDRKDLVLGAKGSGKSSLWKEITGNSMSYGPIFNVQIGLATNPNGDPEFRDVLAAIGKEEFPDIDELRVGWRIYFLAQFWKAAETFIEDPKAKEKIQKDLTKYGIIQNSDSGLKVAFAFAFAKARALKQLKIEWTRGLSLDFGEEALRAGGSAMAIPFNDLMASLDAELKKSGYRIWLVLDRLDEIILGDENKENQVLKGLLLAYRDVSDYPNLRIKTFLRDDVYLRVVSLGHFPALTHVRSKAAGPIKWEYDDLLLLITKRLLTNDMLKQYLEIESIIPLNPETCKKIIYTILPNKIDKGRATEGFRWIVNRIADGNGVATPRDLLSVFDAARLSQIESLDRGASDLPDKLLFSEEVLRKAVKKVAKDNLETRIYAEYPDLRAPIERFRDGKADHNSDSLKKILGAQADELIPRLQRVGFLYRRNRKGVEMLTVPFFFSFALDISRGAAFDLPGGSDDELEEE